MFSGEGKDKGSMNSSAGVLINKTKFVSDYDY